VDEVVDPIKTARSEGSTATPRPKLEPLVPWYVAYPGGADSESNLARNAS
jgi:hypothetical protein